MTTYTIERTDGPILGDYTGDTERDALEAMLQDAGVSDYSDYDTSDYIITEVESSDYDTGDQGAEDE